MFGAGCIHLSAFSSSITRPVSSDATLIARFDAANSGLATISRTRARNSSSVRGATVGVGVGVGVGICCAPGVGVCAGVALGVGVCLAAGVGVGVGVARVVDCVRAGVRSEEHTSELQFY